MLAHAGYSYSPGVETADQGRRRCAVELARAEKALSDSGSSVEWVEDDDPDTSWLDQDGWEDHKAAHERGEYVFMGAILRDPDGAVLKSLWGIDLPADWYRDPYRRVVEAELASEAGALVLDPAREALKDGA
jgi:hypothetical protein